MRRALSISAALLAVLTASPVAAADWEFELSPYFWAAGLDGEIGVFPRLPPVSVDESFSDIFDQLQFAALAAFEARTGKFGILTDFIYISTDASKSATIADRRFISVDLKTKTATTTLAALWRVAEQERLRADVLGGTRLVWTETELTLRRDDGQALSAEPDQMWMDAIVGARAIYALSPRWSLTAYGDVGGLQSEITWQAYAAANYQASENVRLSAGWRYYDVDYDNEGFVYDVSEDGPMLAATFSF